MAPVITIIEVLEYIPELLENVVGVVEFIPQLLQHSMLGPPNNWWTEYKSKHNKFSHPLNIFYFFLPFLVPKFTLFNHIVIYYGETILVLIFISSLNK